MGRFRYLCSVGEIDAVPAPRDVVAAALTAYLEACESPDATPESIRDAHFKFFKAVEAWTKLTERAALPADVHEISKMDIRYREDGRGVEQITITAATLDQIQPLTRFLTVLADARRLPLPVPPKGLLEID
jgi:hypothetical protein